MKQTFISLALVALATAASPAVAGCYAGYKAKQDDPLKLHYGVIDLSTDQCPTKDEAWDTVEKRLRAAGWTLLDIVDVFQDDGLDQRRQSAGSNFLRY